MSRHSSKKPHFWDEYIVLALMATLLGIIIWLVRMLP